MVQAVLVMVVVMTVIAMVIAIMMTDDRARPRADHRPRGPGPPRAGRRPGDSAFSGIVDRQGAVGRRQRRHGARQTDNSIHYCLSKKRCRQARRTPKRTKRSFVPGQVLATVNHRSAP